MPLFRLPKQLARPRWASCSHTHLMHADAWRAPHNRRPYSLQPAGRGAVIFQRTVSAASRIGPDADISEVVNAACSALGRQPGQPEALLVGGVARMQAPARGRGETRLGSHWWVSAFHALACTRITADCWSCHSPCPAPPAGRAPQGELVHQRPGPGGPVAGGGG